MGDYGFRWVKWDAWARAQGKTTEKEAQMVVSRLFWQGHGEKKNQELDRDGWGSSPRVINLSMYVGKHFQVCLCVLQTVLQSQVYYPFEQVCELL